MVRVRVRVREGEVLHMLSIPYVYIDGWMDGWMDG
jgi:hypothetical protein